VPRGFQRRDGAEADPLPAIGVAFDDIAILGLVTTGIPNLATGRFLLTGSAGPATAPSHSGAGAPIVTLRMRPMTLAERGIGGRRSVSAGCCGVIVAK